MPNKNVHPYIQIKSNLQYYLPLHYKIYTESSLENKISTFIVGMFSKPSMSKGALLNIHNHILCMVNDLNPYDTNFVDHLVAIVVNVGIFTKNIQNVYNSEFNYFEDHLKMLKDLLKNVPFSELQQLSKTYAGLYYSVKNTRQVNQQSASMQSLYTMQTLREIKNLIDQTKAPHEAKQKALKLRIDISSLALELPQPTPRIHSLQAISMGNFLMNKKDFQATAYNQFKHLNNDGLSTTIKLADTLVNQAEKTIRLSK